MVWYGAAFAAFAASKAMAWIDAWYAAKMQMQASKQSLRASLWYGFSPLQLLKGYQGAIA